MDPWRTAIATSDATNIWIRGHVGHVPDAGGDVHRHDLPAPPGPAAVARRAPAARRPPDRVADHGAGRAVVRRRPAGRVGQPVVDLVRGRRRHPGHRRRPRRRRLELHGADRGRAWRAAEARRADAGGRGAAHGRGGRARASGGCPGSAIASTPPIRASRCSSTWRAPKASPATASSSWRRSKPRRATRIKPLPMNIDGALAGDPARHGLPAAGRAASSSSSARVAGLTAEVAEEYAREKPMRIKFQVDYDGPPADSRNKRRAMASTNDHRGRNRSRPRAGRARARRDGGDRATTTRPPSTASAARSRWAGGNEQTATRLANMSVDESGMGRREPTRRAKVQGILRDALRQKSMGIIEEDPVRGLVKYAKPAGVIAGADPGDQPLRHAGRHRDLRDQVQGRGGLLAAPVEPQHDDRDRAHHARGAEEARRAGGRAAGRRAAEHPARQRADGGSAI